MVQKLGLVTALAEIDQALTLDPGRETLETFRALCLVRLGRSAEAADIYEQVLMILEKRSRKWRIVTRDQAAECYRRWAEQDRSSRDATAARLHLERAISILNEALAQGDHDKRTAALYGNIIEDGLFLALTASDDAYAIELLIRLEEASHLLTFLPFRRLSAAQFTTTFASKNAVLTQAKQMVERGQIHWSEKSTLTADTPATTVSANEIGTIKSLRAGTNFGFITDTHGLDWFFHRNHLTKKQEWNVLQEGQKVRFSVGHNAHGKCAIDIEVVEA